MTSRKTLEGGDQSPKNTQIKIHWRDLQPFFPQRKFTDLQNIRMTKECLYSSTPIVHSEYMRDIIRKFYDEKTYSSLIITDATSCIGGTFMSMVKVFGKINAVELNPLHARMMENNMKTIFPEDHNKIEIINANYLSVFDTFNPKSNVVIIDPPWGGINYAKKKNIKLFLESEDKEQVELVDIINKTLPETDVVMIRIPYNYDMERLDQIQCKFVKKFKFVKDITRRRSRRRLKISYYIYVFANIDPVYNLSEINSRKYTSRVSCRKIVYEEL